MGRLYRRDGNELTTSGASLSTRMRSKSGLKPLRDLAWWRHVISLTGDKLDLPWWNASELLGVARSFLFSTYHVVYAHAHTIASAEVSPRVIDEPRVVKSAEKLQFAESLFLVSCNFPNATGN